MIANGPGTLVGNFLAGIPASRTALLCRSRVKTLVISALLFVTLLAAYWPTTFHYYGMRDDYSKLREAHEEPGKVLHFCASNARPIYGYPFIWCSTWSSICGSCGDFEARADPVVGHAEVQEAFQCLDSAAATQAALQKLHQGCFSDIQEVPISR